MEPSPLPTGAPAEKPIDTPVPSQNAKAAGEREQNRENRQGRIRLGPLERRLFWIVFVGLLPLALLAFITLLSAAQGQKQRLMRSAADATLGVTQAVDAELALSFAALDALAASPRLAQRDFERFRLEAQAMLERRPGWANVVLTEPSSQQVVNAFLPADSPLPSGIDPQGIQETVRTNEAHVGNLVYSPILKQHGFAIYLPIHQAGKVAYVLAAVIRPDSLRAILQRQPLPEGSLVALLDRNPIVVTRSLNHEDWIGKPPSATLLRLIHSGKEGTAYTYTLEGAPVYTVYRRSRQTGWWVAAGIPRQALEAPVIRSYLMLGGLMLASLGIGLFAAFVTGRSVTRPIRELERVAAAIGRGQTAPLPDTDLPEIQLAASALIGAHAEREKLLQNERAARQAAEDASKAKDEFLAMLGHELRNPLAAIANASQLLDHAGRTHSRPLAEEAAAIVRRQVRHLARLTDDLLDAGRVVLGKIALDRKPVDLAVIVQSAVETLRNSVAEADYEFQISLESVWVDADATRLDQMIANLLTNAVKYTPPPGAIAVSLRQQGDTAVLRVRDSGMGIEAELLPRVFDIFVQGTRSLDRSEGGLGIGLTLVHRLAELHGGQVTASSAGPGTGSEFTIRLPAIEALHPALPDTPSASGAHQTLVIVEDNSDVRLSLRTLLELDGHEVHEAADGPAGVETVLRTQARIALIDVGLPLMNGYDVARAIKARATFPVRLIAMTGYGREEDIARGKDAGFEHYLVKPVDPTLLAQIISKDP